MAKEYARSFYNSKAWKNCRMEVFKRDFGLCVRCGKGGQEVHHIQHITPVNINDPNITLNHDNLITLCKDCHHREHERNQFGGQHVVEEGLMFDESGQLVEK